MIDPVTAVGMATAAYNGLKSAIATGKEISEMGQTLNQWATSISDLDFAHKQAQDPPMFKKMFGASQIEQKALEVWGHKRKAEEMREELRKHISFVYGPSAWEEIVRIEAKMRKERKEAIYAAEERKQEILEIAISLGLALFVGAVISAGIYFIGASQGRW